MPLPVNNPFIKSTPPLPIQKSVLTNLSTMTIMATCI